MRHGGYLDIDQSDDGVKVTLLGEVTGILSGEGKNLRSAMKALAKEIERKLDELRSEPA